MDLTDFSQALEALKDGEIGLNYVIWDGKDKNFNSVSSGIYLYKLEINNVIKAVNKCMLIK